MSRTLADALAKLHAAPNGQLALSKFTHAQRRELDAYAAQTGAIQRAVIGGGSVYKVQRAPAVALRLKALRPGLFHPVNPDAPRRAPNLAMHRDTKAGAHRHEEGFLLLKGIGAACRWRSQQGELDVASLTRRAGLAAIQITPSNDWVTDDPVWLVENQELFTATDWLPPEATGTLIYYAGTLSGVLLAWLTARPRAPGVQFFADYDGAGLLNYARLLNASQSPVTFWMMPGWRLLFDRYASDAQWVKTRHQAESALGLLKEQPLDPEVAELIKIMRREARALEHEAAALWSNHYGTPE